MTEQEMKTELAFEITLRDMSQAALDAHIVRIATLELDLAAAEKPELRSGHYGYFKDNLSGAGQEKFVIYGFDGSDVQVSINGCRRRMGKEYFRQHIVALIGNIFDDLRALSEPLTYFKADVHEYKIDFRGHAHAPVEVAGNWHTLAEAKQISLKLQRLVRTAVMEEAK